MINIITIFAILLLHSKLFNAQPLIFALLLMFLFLLHSMTGVGEDVQHPVTHRTVAQVARPEIIVEGSADGETWKTYEFRYKPGNVTRAPVKKHAYILSSSIQYISVCLCFWNDVYIVFCSFFSYGTMFFMCFSRI